MVIHEFVGTTITIPKAQSPAEMPPHTRLSSKYGCKRTL